LRRVARASSDTQILKAIARFLGSGHDHQYVEWEKPESTSAFRASTRPVDDDKCRRDKDLKRSVIWVAPWALLVAIRGGGGPASALNRMLEPLEALFEIPLERRLLVAVQILAAGR
jgi:hypothetical protein